MYELWERQQWATQDLDFTPGLESLFWLAMLGVTAGAWLMLGALVDLPRVLAKLSSQFGIRKLLLEGGGTINGTFLAAEVIDELSILVAPVADERRPALEHLGFICDVLVTRSFVRSCARSSAYLLEASNFSIS